MGPRLDEWNHYIYGDRILDFYASGFEKYHEILETPYGGGYDLLGALVDECLYLSGGAQ